MTEKRAKLVIEATGAGTLVGRIARLSIVDTELSLAFKIHIPVILSANQATLSIDLRYPEVRSWRALRGRNYRFDESTRRYEKSDGETYARDDVFSDIRTAAVSYDTFITRVTFGSEGTRRLIIAAEGTVRVAEGPTPFVIDAQVQVGAVVVERGTQREVARQLDLDAYQPPVVRDGLLTYDPKF